MEFLETMAGSVALRFWRFWSRIREWCGDAAYERYLLANAKAGKKAGLNAEEFYVEQTNRRYSQPNRCC